MANVDKYKGQCHIHGEFEGVEYKVFKDTFQTGCPMCNKARDEEREREEQELKERHRKERIFNGIRLSRIPEKYQGLLSFTPRENQKLKAWDKKQNVILIGGTGSGKTSYACHLGMTIIYNGDTVRYCTASELVARIKNGWGDSTSEKVLEEYINADFLILDEMGRCTYDDYLFRLFDGRYNASKPTILLGNLTPKEIKGLFGDAIYSRLMELGVVGMDFDITVDYRVKEIF